jgi:hypothetical protein
MSLDEHLDYGDKVEEEREAAEMDAVFAPAFHVMEHGWEDCDARRSVQNSRNS